MQRGLNGGGSTHCRRYPCSAKCVISPNFKHGCFEKVHASHLNVSPDITFIQFASQLRASMVSSHTHPQQPTGVVEIVNSKVLLRGCQNLTHFFPHSFTLCIYFFLHFVQFGPMIFHKLGWLCKLVLCILLAWCLHHGAPLLAVRLWWAKNCILSDSLNHPKLICENWNRCWLDGRQLACILRSQVRNSLALQVVHHCKCRYRAGGLR